MTRFDRGIDPTAQTAARHLKEFGFLGLHLRPKKGQRPGADFTLGDSDCFERQVVQAEHYAAEDFPYRDDSTVFLMMGKPRPRAGDALVALTRYWTIEQIDVMHLNDNEQIYAVLCV